MSTRVTVIILIALVILAIAALFMLRGDISRKVYYRQGEAISSALTPQLNEKYGEDLSYTLDKFWSCYKSGIVTQNDLTDVMERMKDLRSEEEISDRAIFDLIGYISRLYTDAMRKHHEDIMDETEPGA
ncbi:MAG: hypothetical protein JW814_03130 [Candidatus Krumholzibacteriota bacterium]|nr:hypothetical protein [Candidatus Krumholzibacteriota bacterium]